MGAVGMGLIDVGSPLTDGTPMRSHPRYEHGTRQSRVAIHRAPGGALSVAGLTGTLGRWVAMAVAFALLATMMIAGGMTQIARADGDDAPGVVDASEPPVEDGPPEPADGEETAEPPVDGEDTAELGADDAGAAAALAGDETAFEIHNLQMKINSVDADVEEVSAVGPGDTVSLSFGVACASGDGDDSGTGGEGGGLCAEDAEIWIDLPAGFVTVEEGAVDGGPAAIVITPTGAGGQRVSLGFAGLSFGSTYVVGLTATVGPDGVTEPEPVIGVGTGQSATFTVRLRAKSVIGVTAAKTLSEATLAQGDTETVLAATLTGTNTGSAATTLTVTDPAPGTSANPFGYLRLAEGQDVVIVTWPSGATRVQAYVDGAPVGEPVANAGDGQALELPEVSTSVSFEFSGEGEESIGTSDTAVITLPLVLREGVTSWPESITNTVRVTAEGRDDARDDDDAQATVELVDPNPYAAASKQFTEVGAAGPEDLRISQLPVTRPGVAWITATNVGVPSDGLTLTEPAPGRGSTGMFVPEGLVFGGFGSGATDGGTGVILPDGVAAAEVTVTSVTSGEPPTHSQPISGTELPTPEDFGLTSWGEVTGFTVAFLPAEGQTIPRGASATVPYLVRPGDGAVLAAKDGHTTEVVNWVLAQSTVGDSVSPTEATNPDGSSPYAEDRLDLAVPTIAVGADKVFLTTHVAADPGQSTVVRLQATARVGQHGGNTAPTSLVIEETAAASPDFWAVFAPTALVSATAEQDGVTRTVEYTTDGEDWTGLTGSSLPADILGFRLTFTKPAGFENTESVNALVRFEVRDTEIPAAASTTGLDNCVLTDATLAGYAEIDAEEAEDCATVRLYDGSGTGAVALVKHLSAAVTEGAAQTVTGTLTWGTAGRTGLDRVEVADAATDSAGDPLSGRDRSFWDTFDVVGVGAIASGADRPVGVQAWDPYLIFDEIVAVEYWDGDSWEIVSDAGWTGGFPGVTLTPQQQTVAQGVRLVYRPLDASTRAVVQAGLDPGDWRKYLDLDAGVVATDGPEREITVTARLRDVSRAAGEPLTSNDYVNNAFTYNYTDDATNPGGKVVNSGLVVADGEPLGEPANPEGQRFVQILPAQLNADSFKTWRRADNHFGGDDSVTRNVGLPSGEAILIVQGWNASQGDRPRVTELTITEPADSSTDPFETFEITAISVSRIPTGAQSAVVEVRTVAEDEWYGLGGVRDVSSGAPFDVTAGDLAAAGVALADVRQVRVVFSGQIQQNGANPATADGHGLPDLPVVAGHRVTSGAFGELTLATTVRDGVTAQDEPILVGNTAGVSVRDERVCQDEPIDNGGGFSCGELASDTEPASDFVTLSDEELRAYVTKTIVTDAADGSVLRDGGEEITVTLRAQNLSTAGATELVLTDDDPTFFNAVDLSSGSVSLPGGADAVRFEYLVQSGAFSATQPGSDWIEGSVEAGSLVLDGHAWPDVVGLRLTFSRSDHGVLSAPSNPEAVVTVKATLREFLRSAPTTRPSAVGAESWPGELATNPGEGWRGLVADTATAVARNGEDTSPTVEASASLTVNAGEIDPVITKEVLDSQGRVVDRPEIRQGGYIPFRLTLTNDGDADIIAPLLVDYLPEEGYLSYEPDYRPSGLDEPYAITGALAATPPTVTHDAAAATVTFAWGTDAVLAKGQSVTVVLYLRLADNTPGDVEPVNELAVSSEARPFPIGAEGCAEGSTYDEERGCVTSSPGIVVRSSTGYVSEMWVTAEPDVMVGAANVIPGREVCAPKVFDGDPRGWYRYPCPDITSAGANSTWRLQVTEDAGSQTSALEVVNVLPYKGDELLTNGRDRLSTWSPFWTGGIVASVLDAAGNPVPGAVVKVQYSTAPGLSYDPSVGVDPALAQWTDTPPSDPSRVTAFRFELDLTDAGLLPAGFTFRVDYVLKAPDTVGVSGGDAAAPDAWSSFGYQARAVTATGEVTHPWVEPLKVGVRFDSPTVVTPPPGGPNPPCCTGPDDPDPSPTPTPTPTPVPSPSPTDGVDTGVGDDRSIAPGTPVDDDVLDGRLAFTGATAVQLLPLAALLLLAGAAAIGVARLRRRPE